MRNLYVVGLCDWDKNWEWYKAYDDPKDAQTFIDRAKETNPNIAMGDYLVVEYDG